MKNPICHDLSKDKVSCVGGNYSCNTLWLLKITSTAPAKKYVVRKERALSRHSAGFRLYWSNKWL